MENPRAAEAVTDHSVVPDASTGAGGPPVCAAAGPASATSAATTSAAAGYNRHVTTFQPLDQLGGFDALLAGSARVPVILFKHSHTCGISHMARESLAGGHVPAPVHELVVQRQRALSDAIASRLGVRHESPQVLVVAGGAVVWHTSHAGVTAARVSAAWHEAAEALTPSPAR